jgi:hypothetical protein
MKQIIVKCCLDCDRHRQTTIQTFHLGTSTWADELSLAATLHYCATMLKPIHIEMPKCENKFALKLINNALVFNPELLDRKEWRSVAYIPEWCPLKDVEEGDSGCDKFSDVKGVLSVDNDREIARLGV